jgi:hypothetical protein
MYARYTEVLRDLMQDEHIAPLLDKALSTYPLYQGKKAYDLIPTREELNRKLLNHYKYREIGFETVGRFLDELQITMEEIMPLYNERLKSIETMADIPNPFDNIDIIEQYDEQRADTASGTGSGTAKTTSTGKDTTSASSQGESNSTSSGTNSQTTNAESNSQGSETNSSTTNGKSVESDTPQDSLKIGSKNIDNVSYASMAKWDENISNGSSSNSGSETSESSTEGSVSSTGTNTNTATSQGENNHESSGTSNTTSETTSQSSGTTSHTFTKKGNQGVNTYAHDMNEFRTSFIDVVNEIINDRRINELFMLVY